MQQQRQMSQITDWAATEQADLTAIAGTLTTIATGRSRARCRKSSRLKPISPVL